MVVSGGQISLLSVVIVKDKHEPFKTAVPALAKQGRLLLFLFYKSGKMRHWRLEDNRLCGLGWGLFAYFKFYDVNFQQILK